MATYNKFFQFVEDLGLALHNCNTHTFKVYLSNAVPSQSADVVKADLAEIAGGNGYTATGTDVVNTWSETGGVATLAAAADPAWTASGGTIGPFQYVVLYNDDVASPLDPLIAWWDYGSAVTLQIGESFTVTITASLFTLT